MTSENFDACVELSVEEGQQHFVADNLYSIAQAYVRPEMVPKAIYARDQLVGFTMYGKHPRTGEIWIVRLMIDHRYQGNGYGTEAMRTLINALVDADHERIYTSYVDSNSGARRVYEKLGFKSTGERHKNEVEMLYEIDAGNVSL